MEIKIRGLEPHIVKLIDEMARKKNYSRNEFLKKHLEILSVSIDLKKQENKFEEALKSVREIIEIQSKEIKELREIVYITNGLKGDK